MAAIRLASEKENMDEDQNSEEQEVTTLDQEVSEEASNDEAKQVEEDKQERNWRELRKKEQEAAQKIRMQEEMINRLLSQQPQQQVQAEPEEEYDPTDFPTWGAADKRFSKQAEQIAERKFRELEQKREQERFLERLKAKHSDFDDIVNPETIQKLEQTEPELAQTIAELKDPYKMGLTTYKYVKALGLSPDKVEKRHAKEVEDKLEKKSIPSPQAYDKRPMAKAFDHTQLSREEKTRLYQEMMQYSAG